MTSSRFERFVTDLLRHPWTMRVKAMMRDAWWLVRGQRVRNPVLRARPRRLLFVCKGNICRSPFAERLAARLLAEAGAFDIRCVSAGFEAFVDGRSPAAAIDASTTYGVSLADHRPKQLTAELMKSCDVVVVNEVAHANLLSRQYPGEAARVVLLPLYARDADRGHGYRRFNIADPYGRPRAAFDECYTYIDRAVRGLLDELTPPSRRTESRKA